MTNQSPTLKSWLFLGMLSLVWGSSFILMKKGLVVFNAAEVAALRIFSAGLFMVPFVFKQLKKLSKSDWFYLIISGFVGSLAPAFLFTTAETQIPSGITGVLNATTPLFVFVLGIFFFSQPFQMQQALGLFTGFVGSAILVMGSSAEGSGVNMYALLVVLATFFYGINLNLIKARLSHIKPVAITGISLATYMPILGVYLFFFSEMPHHLAQTEGAWKALGFILILGVIGTAVALMFFNRLVQDTSPIFTSSVTYLIPIIAMVWGILDGEVLEMSHLLGMATILVGVYFTNRKAKIKGVKTATAVLKTK